MPNQSLRPGTAHKSKRHTSNFANVFRGKQQGFFNCISYIKSKDEESFVKHSFLMSSVLYCNGKSSFHSHLTEMSEYFNLPDFNTGLLDTATKKFFFSFTRA